jgi:vacuolar-type H+-ATPase subunit E/Vma4
MGLMDNLEKAAKKVAKKVAKKAKSVAKKATEKAKPAVKKTTKKATEKAKPAVKKTTKKDETLNQEIVKAAKAAGRGDGRSVTGILLDSKRKAVIAKKGKEERPEHSDVAVKVRGKNYFI